MVKKRALVKTKTAIAATPVVLLAEIRQIILEARQKTYQAVNAALTLTYWRIGDRIRREILGEKRAEYGKEIVSALGRQLEKEFGRGFSDKSLRDNDALTPDLVFRDPYILDFLGLKDTYCEQDLEAAILREIEAVLLELGAGFAFVERQKRITLDGDDYYIDLLFFHRKLRRLVVVELKIGDFRPADAGQVELYLRWLDRHERQPGEDRPMALILCAGNKKETIEYLDLGEKGIHVAEYLTELPDKELLQRRLHAAVVRARERLTTEVPPAPRKKGAKR